MAEKPLRVWNINVGVLGHVDSGKTSLVAALSTRLSTAALDKNPQSKERGITLDLGFSSFSAPLPEHAAGQPFDEVQFTLVDCPGHASLMRTIIGGAQIIDMMLLVIDVTKGIQAQTAECLVLGELATDHLVVALNKVDLLPLEAREKLVGKARKRLMQTFALTKFAGCTVMPVAAKPGGGDEAASAPAVGLPQLVAELVKRVPEVPRSSEGNFLFAIDHCFAIRGHGTVLTGTVMQGSLKVNDVLELPQQRLQKKVRSMQMFRRPVQRCTVGDRVGICVSQLDPKTIERGLACTPGSVPTFSAAIAAVEKIRFFQGDVRSKAKIHVTIGHSTVMAELTLLGVPDGHGEPPADALRNLTQRIGKLAIKGSAVGFDYDREYAWQEQLYGLEGRPPSALLTKDSSTQEEADRSSGAATEAVEGAEKQHYGPQWAYLQLSQPVTAPADAMVIGARFDADVSTASCRLAFYGRLTALVDPADKKALPRLKVVKLKAKYGSIERIATDGYTAICKGMFKKETDMSLFAGMKVTTAHGETGTIQGTFGKSGKFTVLFKNGLKEASGPISLVFKKLLFAEDKRKMTQ